MKLTELLVDTVKMNESQLCSFYRENAKYFDYIWPAELLKKSYSRPALDKLHAAASTAGVHRDSLIKEFLGILCSKNPRISLFGDFDDQSFSAPGHRSYALSQYIKLGQIDLANMKIGQMNCVRRSPEELRAPFYQLHFAPTPKQLRIILKEAEAWKAEFTINDQNFLRAKVDYMGRLYLPDTMNRNLWNYPVFSQKEFKRPVEFLDFSAVYFGDDPEYVANGQARIERESPEKISEKIFFSQTDLFRHLVTSTGPVRIEPVEVMSSNSYQDLEVRLSELNKNGEFYIIESSETQYSWAIWRKLYYIE